MSFCRRSCCSTGRSAASVNFCHCELVLSARTTRPGRTGAGGALRSTNPSVWGGADRFLPRLLGGADGVQRERVPGRDDLVDEAVLDGLRRSHDEVAVGVLRDPLGALSGGVEGQASDIELQA